MNISRFDAKTASKAHQDTILASDVLPGGMKAPFQHAWGYLGGKGSMELHKHPTHEVYCFFEGEGFVVVGDERQPVCCGDVVEIPVDILHTVENENDTPLLWAAMWWMPETEL